MEHLRNQICLLGVQNTKTASHTDTCSQQASKPAAFSALRSQITDFLHIMNSNAQTCTRTFCSQTKTASQEAWDHPHLICSDSRYSQFLLPSLLFHSHSYRASKNYKSLLDIPCSLLLCASCSECWSSERFHVKSNNLTTSCCSDGERGLEGVKLEERQGGEGKREETARVL